MSDASLALKYLYIKIINNSSRIYLDQKHVYISTFVSLMILSPQCSHIQDCYSRRKSELHDDIQHVLPGLVELLPITICRVESVDVDEVSARVPQFLSYRLDDHSLPCTVVSQENYALITGETVNQLLLFRSPE